MKASWNQLLADDLSASAPIQPEVYNDVRRSGEKTSTIVSRASYAKIPDNKLENSYKVNISDAGSDGNVEIRSTKKSKRSRADSDTSSEHAPDYYDDSDDDGFTLTCWQKVRFFMK